MASSDMDALRQIFFQECEEQLAELESGLLEIESGDSDSEIVNAVFRAVHSIKGGAGAFAIEDLVRFAHVFETVLDEVRKGRLAAAGQVVETLLRSADVLADLVRVARDGGDVDEPRIRSVSDELAALSGAHAVAEADAPEENLDDLDFKPVIVDLPVFDDAPIFAEPPITEYAITFKPHPSLYANANEPAVLMRELERLGEITVVCDTASVPPLTELDPEAAYLSWSIELKTTHGEDDVRAVFEFVDGDCDLTIVGANSAVADPGEDDIAALLRRVREETVELAEQADPVPADITTDDRELGAAGAPRDLQAAPLKAESAKGDKGAGIAVFRADLKRDAAAGMLFLIHGRRATYHVGWTSEEGRTNAAHNLILWTAMKELKTRGVAALDLGGVNTQSGAGIARFKLETGGEVLMRAGAFV